MMRVNGPKGLAGLITSTGAVVLAFTISLSNAAFAQEANLAAFDDSKTAFTESQSLSQSQLSTSWVTPQSGQVSAGQQKVADAQVSGQGLFFAEVRNVRVVKVLPDDTQGLQHQKWVVALDNGNQLMAVYNTDICDRVPVRVGDVMSIGGQYIWDRGGGLLHWLHGDPRHSRPDGYVEVNGRRYGAITHPNR